MDLIYKSDRAVVWCGDALDVLETMDAESLGLVVTDPPYGVEWRSNRRAERFDLLAGDGADDRAGISDVLTQCVRVVGQHRHLYVFGPQDVLAGQKIAAPVELVWDKGALGAGDMTAAWGPAHERITFAVSKWRHAGETGREGVPGRLRKGSVLRYTRVTGRKVRHPSEKPVPLLRELIESSTRQGDVVLDPFAGSGGTGVAALLSGRRCVLIDVERGWADMSAARVRAAEKHWLAGEAL